MLNLYVISGGPSTGKTATIQDIKERGYKVLPEAARIVSLTDKRFIGKTIKEINANQLSQFQKAIFDFQKEELSKLNGEKPIFLDRGLGDTLTYYRVNNLKIPEDELEYAKKVRYTRIFILDFLDFYKKDELRTESKEEQEKIQKEIIKMYKELGYKSIIVPFMSIKERTDFILKKIKKKGF